MTGFRVKAIYILLYMGYAVWKVFYNLYLDENNLSGFQIGTLNALIQASVVLIVPVWGVIADKRGIRPTLRMAVLVSAILISFLGGVLNFWLLIIYIIFLTFFILPLGPLTDALAVEYTKINAKYNYGNLRLWGSLGWGLASVLAGLVFAHINLKFIFPVSAGIFLLSLYFFRLPGKRKRIFRPHFQPISIKELVKNKSLMIFLGILFLYGVASSPVNAYINLYFSELHADNFTIGSAFAIQSFSEIPFFILGNILLKRLGAKRIILLSMFFMTVRLFIYWMFPEITFALLTGVLQGITLSFFLVGVVHYINKKLPVGREATAQSLIWGLYFGIGHTLGNLFVGILKDHVGMVGVMKYFSVLVFCLFISTLMYFRWQKKKGWSRTSFSKNTP